MAVVDKDWLLDTICSYSLRPLLNYTSGSVTRLLLEKCGYTGNLILPKDKEPLEEGSGAEEKI